MHRSPAAQSSRYVDHRIENADSSKSLSEPQRQSAEVYALPIHYKPPNPRHRGLPKTQPQAQRKENGRKPPSFFIERRKQHAAAGPTPPSHAGTTEESKKSVQGKWDRFCHDELQEDPEAVMQNLGAAEIKTFFDWIDKNFRGSVKADSSFSNYWRVLKGLYYEKTFKTLDDATIKDCINYRREVSKRMGLRKLPQPKPVSRNDDLLHFLVVHLVWDDSVFPDEAQRFYLFAGLNLSSVTSCRAVSLFDTRKNTDDYESPGTEEGSDCEKNKPLAEDHSSDGTASEYDHDDTLAERDHEEEVTAAHRAIEWEDTDFSANWGDMKLSEADTMCDTMCDTLCDDVDMDVDYESDISSVTDDGYLAGDDETRTILWRHISFRIVRNPQQGMPNLLIAIVSLVNTKGQDRKPRVKRFVIEHEDNPLFDLLGQLVAMAFHDEIFVAEFKDVEEVYLQNLPSHKRGLELKIKRGKLDIPIFREPERSDCGYRTSLTVPLKARTWSRYQERLGEKGGSKENLTQKVWRRGTINAINNKAPASVRDQIADHESNAVKYYINEMVEFDTAAAFLERPSNEAVQKEARLVTLLADMTAPTGITEEQKIFISRRPKIRRLRRISRILTEEIHAQGYRSWKAAEGTEIYDRKKSAEKELNRELTRLRKQLKEKNRLRHFRDADTAIINAQLSGAPLLPPKPTPPVYSVPEREEAVSLMCRSPADLTEVEVYNRRLACIRLWIRWQDRQERPRRGRLAAPSMQLPPVPELPVTEQIADQYQRRQCPFCVANLSLPRGDRETPFSRVNKMWNHVADIHRQELAAFDTGKKFCSICKARGEEYKPLSVSEFQHHTQEVHKIKLRPHQ